MTDLIADTTYVFRLLAVLGGDTVAGDVSAAAATAAVATAASIAVIVKPAAPSLAAAPTDRSVRLAWRPLIRNSATDNSGSGGVGGGSGGGSDSGGGGGGSGDFISMVVQAAPLVPGVSVDAAFDAAADTAAHNNDCINNHNNNRNKNGKNDDVNDGGVVGGLIEQTVARGTAATGVVVGGLQPRTLVGNECFL
jgi:hypothetical protein